MRIGSRSESWNGCWKMRCRPEPLAQGRSSCRHPRVVRETLQQNTIPIVSLDAAKELDIEDRFRLLHSLATGLETRKVVFLSTSSGLEREGAPPFRWSTCPTTTND